ncbi:MAG: aspartate aminotransferase, partial [bacterium]
LDLLILEDDPYGELYFDTPPPPPIKSFDTEGRVIYLGSFSKVLTPGLRTAWIVAPSEIIAKVELIKEAADLCSSMLDQAIVAECARQDLIQSRLGKLREFYQIRCQTMLSALDKFAPKGTTWTHPTGGLFIWVELASQIDTTEMLSQAVENGVAYVPGAPFYVSDPKVNTLRLAFSKETPERISVGIEKLCQMF